MCFVIDYTAARRAREEEARTVLARSYLSNVAAQVAHTIGDKRQLFMDLMPAELPLELTEAHILKLERNRT